MLELNKEIESYDITLNKMNILKRKIWNEKVIASLIKYTNIENDKFIILAGMKYRKEIIKYIKNYDIPMLGLGIGKQLKFLKEDLKNESIV